MSLVMQHLDRNDERTVNGILVSVERILIMPLNYFVSLIEQYGDPEHSEIKIRRGSNGDITYSLSNIKLPACGEINHLDSSDVKFSKLLTAFVLYRNIQTFGAAGIGRDYRSVNVKINNGTDRLYYAQTWDIQGKYTITKRECEESPFSSIELSFKINMRNLPYDVLQIDIWCCLDEYRNKIKNIKIDLC